MAAGFPAMQAYTTPPNSQGYVQGVQQFSPMNSTSGTPADLSPSSPRNPPMFPTLPLATRQLRPPKSPMYIPAALRPTEKPHRPSPMTPPRSVHGSTDSLDRTESGSFISRRSTGDSKKKAGLGRVTEDEPGAAQDDLGGLFGLPTRNHWKADVDALVCDAPVCQKNFTLFERRHHCRHCGFVFCNAHSSSSIPLEQNAMFHSRGTQSRACEHCFNRYQEWKTERLSGHNSLTSEATATLSTPIKATSRGFGKSPDAQKVTVVGSMSRDWNWSTF